jgi:hypothetical protein
MMAKSARAFGFDFTSSDRTPNRGDNQTGRGKWQTCGHWSSLSQLKDYMSRGVELGAEQC